jgi:hypothetical protein
VVQVALALVLLICSGLMIRTFHALMHVDPGFVAPDTVQTFRFYIPEAQIPDDQAERVVRMDQEIVNKLAAIPGVTSVSFSTAVPMDGRSSNDVLFAQDRVYGASNSSHPVFLQPWARSSWPGAISPGPTPIRKDRSPSSRKILPASIGMTPMAP